VDPSDDFDANGNPLKMLERRVQEIDDDNDDDDDDAQDDDDDDDFEFGTTARGVAPPTFAQSAAEAVCDLDAWRSRVSGRTARQVLFDMWRGEERLFGVDVAEFDPLAPREGGFGVLGVGADTHRSRGGGCDDDGGDGDDGVLPVTGVPTRLVPRSAIVPVDSPAKQLAQPRGGSSALPFSRVGQRANVDDGDDDDDDGDDNNCDSDSDSDSDAAAGARGGRTRGGAGGRVGVDDDDSDDDADSNDRINGSSSIANGRTSLRAKSAVGSSLSAAAATAMDLTGAPSLISLATAATGGDITKTAAVLQRDTLAFGPSAPALILSLDLRPRIYAALSPAGILADTERGVLDAGDAAASLRCARFADLARREEWRRCVAELEAAGVRPTTPDLVRITDEIEELELAAQATRDEIAAVRERTGADARDEEGEFFRSVIHRAEAEQAEALRLKRERDPLWRLQQRKEGLAARAGEPRVARPVGAVQPADHQSMLKQPTPVNRGVFSGGSSSSLTSGTVGGAIKLPLTPAFATIPPGAPPKYEQIGRDTASEVSAPVTASPAQTPRSDAPGAGNDALVMGPGKMGGFRFSSLPAAVNPARQRKKMSKAERMGQDRLLNQLGQEYLDEVLG
jgi:hypothetical protein